MRAILTRIFGRGRGATYPRWLRRATPLGALVLVATACGGDAAGDGQDDTVSVVASFYPLAHAAERVGGGTIELANLTPPGVEPHDLELTPQDLEAIVTADLVIYAGGGFQPAVDEAVREATGRTLDVMEDLATLPPPDDDAHDDAHDDGPEDDHGGEELEADPHVWLDLARYAEIAAAVAAALGEVDPANAATYGTEEAAFGDELAALDDRFRTALETCESRLLVVSHAAFGYLAAAYDLHQEPIAGVSPESEPDPRRLAELRDLVMAENVTTIFTEELVSPAVAETLASEAGVGTAVLNPLEGLTAEQEAAGEDYGSIMQANLEALVDGLRCDPARA
jgi:zinc transport system substrate-binding protein